MMSLLQRLMGALPPLDDKLMAEETQKLRERGKDLASLQLALREIRAASAEKRKMLKTYSEPPPPAQKQGNGREPSESLPG